MAQQRHQLVQVHSYFIELIQGFQASLIRFPDNQLLNNTLDAYFLSQIPLLIDHR